MSDEQDISEVITPENIELEDGELATEEETDDGISLGAPSLAAALEVLLVPVFPCAL